MKTIKRIIALLVLIVTFNSNILLTVAAGNEVSVQSVTVESEKSISVSLDKEIEISSFTSEGVKVIHVVEVTDTKIDEENEGKLSVTLASPLVPSTTYNLVSVAGADGDMDFETDTVVEGQVLENTADVGISSIEIIDATHIDIFYYEELTQEAIELKFLADVAIDAVEADSTTEFQIKTKTPLATSANYILMILAANMLDGSEAETEGGIYDFQTGSNLGSEVVDVADNADIENEIVEVIVDDTIVTDSGANDVADTDLNAAEEVSEDAHLVIDNNIEEVAGEATSVPETGLTSNILVFISLIMTALVSLRRKKA